jgi:hypothetical protein
VDKWGNYQQQINGLYGPWTDKLPNAKNIDFKNPFIGTDFQQQIDGLNYLGKRSDGMDLQKLKIHLKQSGIITCKTKSWHLLL